MNKINRIKSIIHVIFLSLLWFNPLTVLGLEIKGEWIQGGMLIGKVTPGQKVSFMGKNPRIAGDGSFVIGLGRDAPAEVDLVVDDKGNSQHYTYKVKKRVYEEQRVQGVPQETVTPPPEVLQRIIEEAAIVNKARSIDDGRTDFTTGFKMPLQGPITGVYGSRRVYNGTPKNPHYGLDIAAPEGTLVYPPAPGVVQLVHKDMYFSGGTLIIDHGHGITSTYIHLSDILVNKGEVVDRETPVAKVGSTGRATGPHLDWRINWFDVRIDPAVVLQQFPYN